MVGETFTISINPNGSSAIAIGTKNESDATFYGESYAFYLNLRHLENYRYSNFYMFLHTTFPNGSQTHDTIECILAYPDGRWIGKGSGSMRTSKILLNNNLQFPLKGNYHFEIEQAMRDAELKGITDIGVRFEKVEN